MIKVLLLGLGKIGYRYDLGLKQDGNTFTHYQAIKKNDNFELVAAVEPDQEVANAFQGATQVPTFSAIEEIPKQTVFDLIVICSPTEHHFVSATEALTLNPSVLLIEKPLTQTYSESVRMEKICKESNTKVFVNFQRNYSPKFLTVVNQIALGEIKGPFHMSCEYTGTPLNSGSHMISLVQAMFPGSFQITMKDGMGSCLIESPSNKAHIAINRITDFGANIFRYSLLSDFGELFYDSSEDEFLSRKIVEDSNFRGEYKLESIGKTTQLEESKMLERVYNEICNFFNSKPYYCCDLKHGIDNNLLIDQALLGGPKK
jgi:hypothetical protein